MDPILPLLGLQAFVLAKNESANILRGVLALEEFGATVTVLDSGSTDGTLEMIEQQSQATALSYHYRDHVTAYSDVLLRMATADVTAIFDADTRVRADLAKEIGELMHRKDWDVVIAPVEWWCEGHPIPHASMYPTSKIALVLYPTKAELKSGSSLVPVIDGLNIEHSDRLEIVDLVQVGSEDATAWNESFYADSIHPSPAGAAALANVLWSRAL